MYWPVHEIRWGPVVIASLVVLVACGGRETKQQPIEHDKVYSIRMAESLYSGGRVSEALAELERALERFPDDASLYNLYGGYCVRAGRYDEGIRSLERALEIDSYLTDAHNWLGVAYNEQRNHAAAEREFRLALDDPAYPTPEKVYLNLGVMYAEQGRNEEAVEALRRAVGIDPKYFMAHFQLASILERIGKVLEAAREYEVAEPAFRNDGEYWYRRGFAYYRLGEKTKARESLMRVRSVAPGSESAARADELLEVLD
jgi:Tfp pilus assembly protein PilF